LYNKREEKKKKKADRKNKMADDESQAPVSIFLYLYWLCPLCVLVHRCFRVVWLKELKFVCGIFLSAKQIQSKTYD